MSRCDSAAIVPNTSELFPDPDTPVNTVSRRFGSSMFTSLRLFTRAPWTRIRSWLSAACEAGAPAPAFVALLMWALPLVRVVGPDGSNQVADGSSPPKSADEVGHGGAALRAGRFESQGELGALAWRAAHVQVDAHGCGEAAGDVEAEPRAGHAPLGVQALEALEDPLLRSEEHTSELQSLIRKSYAVFC